VMVLRIIIGESGSVDYIVGGALNDLDDGMDFVFGNYARIELYLSNSCKLKDAGTIELGCTRG